MCCRLSEIPAGVYSLKELHYLQLNNNQITTIEDKICDLNMLVNLDVAHNKLKVFVFQ